MNDLQYEKPSNPVPRLVKNACYLALAISTVVWLIALPAVNRPGDFWFFVVVFVIPVGMVCGSVIVMVNRAMWRKILGLLILVPSLGVWVGSLVLVSVRFKIH